MEKLMDINLAMHSVHKIKKTQCIEQKSENKSSVDSMSEAVTGRCSIKNMFLKISQNSQEIDCARVSF